MTKAVCPGSFDPVTYGHLDVVERTSRIFDEVVVAVLINETKRGMFDVDERVRLLEEAVAHLPNVSIGSFRGLLVDFCRDRGAGVIVKGLRAPSDFEYELSMAQMNEHLEEIETVFVPTRPDRSFVSSSLVKEVARWGGDVADLVPDHVLVALTARLDELGRP